MGIVELLLHEEKKEAFKEGFEEGRKIGTKAKTVEFIKSLFLKTDYSIEKIARLVGVSV